MADKQHTAEQIDGRDGLALAIVDPADLPGVNEWSVWIGPAGADPTASDDGTLIGFGPTRESAIAMAKRRLTELLVALMRTRYGA